LSVCAVGFFAYAAAVQWNDVDAAIWGALYGGTALLVATRKRFPMPNWLYGGLAILAALWGVVVGLASLDSTGIMALEERREMGGLLLVAGTMVWLLVLARQKEFSQNKLG